MTNAYIERPYLGEFKMQGIWGYILLLTTGVDEG